jgi:hypothetical protein
MPTGLILLGSIVTVAAGGLVFVVIRRHKPAEPPHFR